LAAPGLRQQLLFPNRNAVGKEPLRQQLNFAFSHWILGCWRRFLSRQQNFPVAKEFLRQQLRSWLLGKLRAVGEATVSCCASFLLHAWRIGVSNATFLSFAMICRKSKPKEGIRKIQTKKEL
jgi:hypothetical protein